VVAAVLVALLSFGQAAPPPQSPIDVALLIDVSDSMTLGPYQRDVALVNDAAGALALRFARGDTARIGAFGSQISIQPPVADPDALRLAASRLTNRLGGSSPLWDAVAEAVKTIPGGPRRRGIIVITDGRATGNRLGFADLLAILRDASVPVFIVSVDPWLEREAKRQREAKRTRPNPDPGVRLEQLAQLTGGTCVFVERKELAAALFRAVNTLRER